MKPTPKCDISLFKLSKRASSTILFSLIAASSPYSFMRNMESDNVSFVRAPNVSGNFGDGEGW